jgi:hypothetical protein
MDRVRLIAGSHRWLLLAALALLALALGSAMFSGASFSSKSANKASLAAGSVKLSSSKPNEAIVSAAGMEPGASREGTIKIGNEGDVAGTVTLSASGLTGSALAAVIELKVDDVTSGTTQKWRGTLDCFTRLAVACFYAATTRTYRFTLSWPSSSDSASLQGASSSLTFNWEGSS